MKTAYKLVCFTMIMSLAVLAMYAGQPMTANAADGTNGSLYSSNSQYYQYGSITLTAEDLDVSSDYAFNFTSGIWDGDDSNNQYTFSTSDTQTKFVLTIENLAKPSSGNIFLIELVKQSAGTLIDSVQLTCRTVSGGLPTSLIMEIAIPVLIFVLVLSVIRKIK